MILKVLIFKRTAAVGPIGQLDIVTLLEILSERRKGPNACNRRPHNLLEEYTKTTLRISKQSHRTFATGMSRSRVFALLQPESFEAESSHFRNRNRYCCGILEVLTPESTGTLSDSSWQKVPPQQPYRILLKIGLQVRSPDTNSSVKKSPEAVQILQWSKQR